MKKNKNTFTISKKSFRFLDLYAMFASLMIVPAIGIYCLQALNTMTAIQIQADYRKPEVEKVKEPTMQEWVMGEIRKAGINEYEAWAVINCESKWNDQAYNLKNSNGTGDFGLFMFNTIHIKSGLITSKCAFDYKCATPIAIKMIKQKGWKPWVCSKVL